MPIRGRYSISALILFSCSGCGGGGAVEQPLPAAAGSPSAETPAVEGTETETSSPAGNPGEAQQTRLSAPTVQFVPVATGIEMHPDKRIMAGDDIIVFGTGGFSGVDYMIPSAGDTAGRGIPEGQSFHASSFAVAGRKVALINNFEVSIFDADSGSLSAIPGTALHLSTVPGQLHDAGHIQADGNYVIARSDDSTDDGRYIKLIDVSGDEPRVIGFRANPPGIAAHVTHVLVDADTNTAVAANQESFYLYDIADPEEDPIRIDVPDGVADLPPQLDDGWLLFHDRNAYPNTLLLNIATREMTPLRTNPSAGVLALQNGSLAYFVATNSNDSVGNAFRCAIGHVNRLDNLVLAPEREFINGSTANHGAVGYGQTVGITDDGGTWLLGGLTSMGSGEYLQVSTGGAFTLVPDPLGEDEHGCYATEISVSRNVVAFKTKGEDYRAAYVGYIVLE